MIGRRGRCRRMSDGWWWVVMRKCRRAGRGGRWRRGFVAGPDPVGVARDGRAVGVQEGPLRGRKGGEGGGRWGFGRWVGRRGPTSFGLQGASAAGVHLRRTPSAYSGVVVVVPSGRSGRRQGCRSQPPPRPSSRAPVRRSPAAPGGAPGRGGKERDGMGREEKRRIEGWRKA